MRLSARATGSRARVRRCPSAEQAWWPCCASLPAARSARRGRRSFPRSRRARLRCRPLARRRRPRRRRLRSRRRPDAGPDPHRSRGGQLQRRRAARLVGQHEPGLPSLFRPAQPGSGDRSGLPARRARGRLGRHLHDRSLRDHRRRRQHPALREAVVLPRDGVRRPRAGDRRLDRPRRPTAGAHRPRESRGRAPAPTA